MLDHRIKTFLKVCQTLNYTRAAEELHITQPAVSQHIRRLEEEYHVLLFKYENKKLALTDEGLILRDRLLIMENDENRILREMKACRTEAVFISIGVTMTIGEYTIGRPLSLLLKKHPAWNIRVVYGNTEKLLSDLQSGEIDLGLVEGYYPEEKFAHCTFSRQPFIGVCASRRSFAGKEIRVMRDLVNERIILREPGSGTREILERNLAVQGLRISDFKSSIEVGNMHTITSLLENDCGISFLYRIVVEEEIKKGILKEIPLEDFHMYHNFDFVWEKDSIYSDRLYQICSEIVSNTPA